MKRVLRFLTIAILNACILGFISGVSLLVILQFVGESPMDARRFDQPTSQATICNPSLTAPVINPPFLGHP